MFDLSGSMSIIQSAGMLLIYEFIIIILYIFTSNPFMQIFAAFQGLSVAELQDYVPTIQTVYFLIFAIAGVIGIVWWVLSTFISEHEYGFQRY